MLQITSVCDVERYEQSGAEAVAITFLSIFVVLIVSDAVLTYFALQKALFRDESRAELEEEISEKKLILEELQNNIGFVTGKTRTTGK